MPAKVSWSLGPRYKILLICAVSPAWIVTDWPVNPITPFVCCNKLLAKSYNINIVNLISQEHLKSYSALILAVAHDEFRNLNICTSTNQVIIDVKSVLLKDNVDFRL